MGSAAIWSGALQASATVLAGGVNAERTFLKSWSAPLEPDRIRPRV
jgi:hypothetical protein